MFIIRPHLTVWLKICLINAAVLSTLRTPLAVSNISPLLSISDGYKMIKFQFIVNVGLGGGEGGVLTEMMR